MRSTHQRCHLLGMESKVSGVFINVSLSRLPFISTGLKVCLNFEPRFVLSDTQKRGLRCCPTPHNTLLGWSAGSHELHRSVGGWSCMFLAHVTNFHALLEHDQWVIPLTYPSATSQTNRASKCSVAVRHTHTVWDDGWPIYVYSLGCRVKV